MSNWIRLIKKWKNINTFDLSTIDVNHMNTILENKKNKMYHMNVIGRWNTLVKKALLRHNNLLRSKVMKRWHSLILKFSRQGSLNLKHLVF